MVLIMKTEKEARDEYNQMRIDDPIFSECWSNEDHDFYEWCSNYLDYKHIERKKNGHKSNR